MELPKYITDAQEAVELAAGLEIISNDDDKDIKDYTQAEVVHEAEWILECYHQSGHAFNDSLRGDDGPQEKRIAQRDVRILKAYIKKYKK